MLNAKSQTEGDAARRMMALFAGRSNAHGTHGQPTKKVGGLKAEIRCSARTLRAPVTLELWESHLKGEKPLGVIPIREDGTSTWATIDHDVYDADLTGMIRRVEELKLPLVPCRSKSGSLHLFAFFAEPTSAAEVVALLREVAATIGTPGSEIFQKQTEVGDDGTGNWIVMPYFGDTYGGLIAQQAGLKRTGAEMTVEEFLRAAERSRVTPEALRANLKQTARNTLPAVVDTGPFADGPPCLQKLVRDGVGEGGRNATLFMMGIYAKRANPTGWQADLERYNQEHMRPPLPAEEVVSLKKTLGKKEYLYTCKTEPLCSVCESKVCRTRTYGIGGGTNFPVITSWRKIEDDTAPQWFVHVEGSERELQINSAGDLRNYRKFTDACAAQLDKFFSSMKQADWDNHLVDMAPGLTSERAPVELTD